MDYRHVESVERLLQSGGAVEGIDVRFWMQFGRLYAAPSNRKFEAYCHTLTPGSQIELPDANMTVFCEHVTDDDDFVKFPADAQLVLRSRKEGDTIKIGGKHKMLKKVFAEHKADNVTRQRCPLVVYNNEVAWIPGVVHGDFAKWDIPQGIGVKYVRNSEKGLQ